MSKYWKALDIDNHQAISDEVYDYVVNHTKLSSEENYFSSQYIGYMLYHCPLLVEFLKKYQLVPFFVGIIGYCNNEHEYPMHRDNDGKEPWLRLLWPVRNCQGSKTKIWQVPDGAGVGNVLENNIIYVSFPPDQERELVEEFELVSPVIFDASCIHSIEANPEIKEQRISFTMGFHKDLPITKSLKAWNDFQV